MIWTPYDCLNKIYSSFNVAAVVGIIGRCSFSIDVHHENQPNNCKLALFKPSIQFNSSFKGLYIRT